MRRLVGLAVAAGLGLGLGLGACGDDNPPAVGLDPFADGGRGLYVEHCASCHGTDLRGSSVGPPFLDKVYEPSHHPDASFRAAVANGVRQHHWDYGSMPPVQGLSAAEVDQIIAYIRARQREPAPR